MLLKAISKDFESFKDEIEKTKRNEFEIEIDDVFPISPTGCMNSPMDLRRAHSLGTNPPCRRRCQPPSRVYPH